MSGHFHLFVYGSLRSGAEGPARLEGAELIGPASVAGTLYTTEEGYPALVLAGSGRVEGEIWRCPAPLLGRLDEYEGVDRGLYRRVGVRVGDIACWTYVLGGRNTRGIRRAESARQ